MKAFFLVHKLATYALGGLVAAHIGAALMHAILLRDGVIWRMLPRGWRPAGRWFAPQPRGAANRS